MSLISGMPTWGKVAVIGGGVAAAALLLAACGKEEDPQAKVIEDYSPFDRNKDNNWSKDELVRTTTSRPYSREVGRLRISEDYVQVTRQLQHDVTTSDMTRAWAGARGNDALASLQELTTLALSFDKPDKNGVKNGLLDGGERRAFEDAYGIQNKRRTYVDNVETSIEYRPRNDYPSTGGNGGTSGGDTHPGGSTGGTAGGDTPGGYTPPPSNGGGSGGTSDGDSHGGYTPPSSGGSSGSSGSGNSTDNGNPSDDDF